MIRLRPAALVVAALLLPAFPARGDVFADWDALEKRIRDNLLPKAEARRLLVRLHARLREAAGSGGKPDRPVFPVRGARLGDVGGKNGSGFDARGFDYYDGTRHHAHPAHDIFIPDRDFDARDDRTGRPVEVLAFNGGVVAALNGSWDEGSHVRGGIYTWVYDPSRDRLCVYAHLSVLAVKLGQRLEAGAVVGWVGRTGKNAHPRRSPTHLHFSCYAFDEGRMTPVDTWEELRRAERR